MTSEGGASLLPPRRPLARLGGRLATLWSGAVPAAMVRGVPTLEDAGRDYLPYVPTHGFPGPLVNARHRQIAEAPEADALIDLGIRGFLRKADALKLYELAYFAPGPVIEFGAGWGLSTTLLCEAVRDADGGQRVTSVENDPPRAEAAALAVDQRGLSRWLELIVGDAATEAARLLRIGRSFAFAFVDHDHSYAATRWLCRLLPRLVMPGGFVLFHDFNDPRNRTEFPGFGCYRGVTETLSDADFAFRGLFGCCALFERRRDADR